MNQVQVGGAYIAAKNVCTFLCCFDPNSNIAEGKSNLIHNAVCTLHKQPKIARRRKYVKI